MASCRLNQVVKHLRKAVLAHESAARTDGQLLEEFIAGRDENAFEILLRRHGPMVLGVCRRFLRSSHDAEDAFQATFLVLIRKAASIVPREMVANWLHGVAYNVALKARAVAARRHVKERQVTVPEREAKPQDLWSELQPLLDQELTRLPDKYRLPIVLCDLEGKTRKEAARQLGWREGTVSGRLSRARSMLAKRLARHGLLVSGGTLAIILSEHTAAAVPAHLVSGTLNLASLLAAGEASLTTFAPTVTNLMEGVLKTMLLSKLKSVSTVCLVAGVFCIGLGATGYLRTTQAAEETPPIQAQPTAANGEPLPTEIPPPPQPVTIKVAQPGTEKQFVVQMQLFDVSSNDQVRAVLPQPKHTVFAGQSSKAVIQGRQTAPVLGKVPYLAKLFQNMRTGVSYELRIDELKNDQVLLDLSYQTSNLERNDDDGMITLGQTLHVVRKIKLGRLNRFAFEKTPDGKPTSWLEISVILDDGSAPAGAGTARRNWESSILASKDTDWEKLQGVWIPVRMTHGGQAVDKAVLARIGKLVIAGDSLTCFDRPPPEDKTVCTFKLDEKQKTIDIEAMRGTGRTTVPHRYAFNGDDELRLGPASQLNGANLLLDSPPKQGGDATIIVWKRQKRGEAE